MGLRPSADLLLTAGILATAVGSVLNEYLPAIDLVSPTLLEWSARFLRDVGLTLAVGVAISSGIRLLRKGDATARGALLLAGGAITWVLVGGLCVYASRVFANVERVVGPAQERLINEMRQGLEAGSVPPDKLPMVSRMYAQLRYERDGTLMEETSADGQRKRYEPTAEDRELRSNLLRLRRMGAWGTLVMRRAAWVWMLVGVCAIAAGLLSPIRGRSVA